MIDFHVLSRNARTSPYLSEALSSLEHHSVFVIDECDSIKAGRLNGFVQGTNPFVAFCDDDDYVQDIPTIEEYLNTFNPLALYTNSNIITNYKPPSPFYAKNYQHSAQDISIGKSTIHQLNVVRRDVAIRAATLAAEILPVQLLPRFDLTWHLIINASVGWEYLPSIHYNWRKWNPSQQSHTQCQGCRHGVIELVNTNIERIISNINTPITKLSN